MPIFRRLGDTLADAARLAATLMEEPGHREQAPAPDPDPPRQPVLTTTHRPAPTRPAPTRPAPTRPAPPTSASSRGGGDLDRQVLGALHHAVMVVTPDRRVLYANQAMCQYIGLVTGRSWTAAELEGMDVMDFHPAPSVKGTDRRFHAMEGAEHLAPRTNPVEELMFMTWDSRLLGDDGQVIGYVLEKIPASFNPSPMPAKSADSLAQVRAKFRQG